MNISTVTPDYLHNFARIPNTIYHLLTGKNCGDNLPKDTLGIFDKKYQKVVFILLDDFGWKYFQKYKNKYPFLKRFIEKGAVAKIHSQFPSTTCAQVSTINFGTPLEKHGLYEWYIYNKKVNSIVQPIRYSYANGKYLGDDINLEDIFPQETLYTRLAKEGVRSYAVQHYEYLNSPYSRATLKGAITYPMRTYSQGFLRLANLVNNEKEKAYFYIYVDRLDGILHHYGEDTQYFQNEIHDVFTALENVFIKNIKSKDTLLIVTADHGHVMIDKEKTFFLNVKVPEIVKYLKLDKDGKVLCPAGSARDFFLHIKDDCIDEVKKLLTKKLSNIANVYTTNELYAKGIFDKKYITKKFQETVGNLVIIPTNDNSVWWYEEEKFDMQFIGVHGGLTKDEMEIPFLIAKI